MAQKVLQGTSALADESAQSNKSLNIEILRSAGEVGERFAHWYAAAIEAEPDLANILIVLDSDPESKLPPGSGFFHHRGETKSGKHELAINISKGWDSFSALMVNRPVATKMIASIIGIGSENLSLQQYAEFAFLHELGHGAQIVRELPGYDACVKLHKAELDSLPASGISPPTMTEIWQETEGQVWWKKNRETVAKAHGVGSLKDLVVLQERKFRELPSEVRADNFARDMLLASQYE